MSMVSKDRSADKIFEGHINDLIVSAEYTVRISEFLSPAEQRTAYDKAVSEGAANRCFFWGGVAEAERRRMVIIPDWMIPEEMPDGGAFSSEREETLCDIIATGADGGEIISSTVSLEISASAYTELEHRDYLGSILALGIERSVIGDIAPTDQHSAVVFVTSEVEKYLTETLCRVRDDAVRVRRVELPEGFRIPREYEVITDTVMSPRLDGIVRSLCKISREEASELVTRGDVTLNYVVENKTDKILQKGDVISVRGHGKFIYDGDRGINRRGRLRIDARKFI